MPPPATTRSDCRACGGSSLAPHFEKGPHRYVRCTGCGFAWLDPMPDEAALARIFDAGYFTDGMSGGYVDYDADERLHRRNARRRLAILEGLGAVAPGPLVDVGCASGYFLDEARQAGWLSSGVERAEWARERATARAAGPVWASLEEAVAEVPGAVGVVSFFQVLEHMPEPARALELAREALRPGGRLVLETWNADSLVARLMGSHWQQVSPPSVLYLTNRRGLTAMIERAGFETPRIRRTGKQVSVAAVLGLIRAKYPALRGLLDPLVAGPLGDLALPYNLGDLITVTTARKS